MYLLLFNMCDSRGVRGVEDARRVKKKHCNNATMGSQNSRAEFKMQYEFTFHALYPRFHGDAFLSVVLLRTKNSITV